MARRRELARSKMLGEDADITMDVNKPSALFAA
jgi:hypothetical protein